MHYDCSKTMPIVAVNLPPRAYDEIRALVERGAYETFEQFLQVAAYNQAALERGVPPDDLVPGCTVHRPMTPHREEAFEAFPREPVINDSERPPPIQKERSRSVPKAELRETIARLSLANVSDLGPTPAAACARPTSERVWGQVNRLFPMKLICRWLLAASSGKRKWEKLDAVAARLATDAANVGSALETSDSACGRKRDEQLSTGLPRRWNVASRERFLSQFVARTTRSAEIHPGAIYQYALATFDGERLVLTDRGVELARLKSPVLDSDSLECTQPTDAAPQTLAREERTFFVDQVLQFVPGESRDLRIVLHAINDGAVRPDDVFGRVQNAFPSTSNWTEAMRRTHISGLVARLCDMALLRRRWEGRSVTYELMAATSDFVARLPSNGMAAFAE